MKRCSNAVPCRRSSCSRCWRRRKREVRRAVALLARRLCGCASYGYGGAS